MKCSNCGRPIIKRNDEWQHMASDRPGVSNVFDHKARPASTIVQQERREKEDRRRQNARVHSFLNKRRGGDRRSSGGVTWDERGGDWRNR